MTTHLPRVGSIELHTAYALVRSGSTVERIDLAVAVRSPEVAAVAVRCVMRERWGESARLGRHGLGGIVTYDVHAPVRAESAESARMERADGGVMSEARNLIEVIDAVVAIVPELGTDAALQRVRRNAGYTAPEMMIVRWREATDALARVVPRTHPRHAEVLAVWNGSAS